MPSAGEPDEMPVSAESKKRDDLIKAIEGKRGSKVVTISSEIVKVSKCRSWRKSPKMQSARSTITCAPSDGHPRDPTKRRRGCSTDSVSDCPNVSDPRH